MIKKIGANLVDVKNAIGNNLNEKVNKFSDGF